MISSSSKIEGWEVTNQKASKKLTAKLRKGPPVLLLTGLLTLAAFIGWFDHKTGWELSLFIFYALPILLAVWWIGTSAGAFIAASCGIIWWIANQWTSPYETQWGYTWAMMSRLFYFGIVVYAVSAVRRQQEADAARITALEERRQLEKDIVSVSEYEQQRIGQDLHDGLCQQLAAIGCAARALAEDLQQKGSESAQDAVAIEESLRQTVMEARDLARGIFPVHVDRDGLSAALRDLAQTTQKLTNVDITLEEDAEVHIDSPEASMHLYRIAQEAVSNAVRHGKARQIWIKITLQNSLLTLIIEDDGTGINHKSVKASNGMGLRTMQYRAQTIGARLFFEPRLNGGFRVRCHLAIQIDPYLPQSHE
jgi:signal transduction histidine kinase